VVVSSSDYQDARPDLVIMAITSQLRVSGEFDGLAVHGWRNAGLLKPSAVKPVFATIAEPLVIRSLGKLPESDSRALRDWMSRLLG
jgi:mRNA interferase MazF